MWNYLKLISSKNMMQVKLLNAAVADFSPQLYI